MSSTDQHERYAPNYLLVSRSQALSAGEKWYFTGEPCHKGHIDKRLVSNSACYQCAKEKIKKYQKKYRRKYNENQKKHKDALTRASKRRHADKINAKRRDAYQKNREFYLAAAKKYRDANKEKARAATKKWAESNKSRRAFLQRTRDSNKKQATPAWADKDAIFLAYQEAHALSLLTGQPYCVDHIVPLAGKTVCGLHVPYNMQLLTLSENSAKKNKWSNESLLLV